MRRTTLILMAIVSLLGSSGSRARADALVRSDAMMAGTIAEIFVEQGELVLELEIGVADLGAFQNLLPNALRERLGRPALPQAERLEAFFTTDMPIVVPGSGPVFGRLAEIGPRSRTRRDAVTGEPLEGDSNEADATVFARLVYPLEGEPAELALGAPVGASVGFVLYHRGVAVNDFRYLTPGAVVTLDWRDPFFSQFEARSLRRQYFASMSVFLYVEPFEVRKEVIVRPFDLQRWVDLGLEGRETIPAEMQPELKRKVAEFLRERQPVEIDGKGIEPELARIHFLERTLRTSRVIDPPEEQSVYSAMLGVIFVYPTTGLPERVTLEWDLWHDQLARVPASSVDQAGPLPTYLEPDWRVLEWQNFLKNPELPTLVDVRPPPSAWERAAAWGAWALALATLVLVVRAVRGPRHRWGAAGLAAIVSGAAFWLGSEARVDDDKGREVTAALLHNVYRAFDHRDEEAIYDVLARSASGDLLEQIYLETRRGLVLASQGGARAKVKEIELVEFAAERADGGGFVADATWQVAGSVGHWGHIHERRNRVRAELRVMPVDGAWRLAELEVLEEERL